jgi:hypothetical protein
MAQLAITLPDSERASVALSLGLEVLGELSVLRPVPVPNLSSAAVAVDVEGRRWVRKLTARSRLGELFSELLGWTLARELGVPIPQGGVQIGEFARAGPCFGPPRDWHDVACCSRLVPLGCPLDDRPGAVEAPCADLGGLAALVVLDIWIVNTDRHLGNLLVSRDEGGRQVIHAIDTGQSLLRKPERFLSAGPCIPDAGRYPAGLPWRALAALLPAAIQRARSLSPARYEELVGAAGALALMPGADVVIPVLRERASMLDQLVAGFLARLPSVT